MVRFQRLLSVSTCGGTAWASHEASTRRRAVAGPLPKNWVPQSDPVTGKVFYLNLRNGELHREHPVLKPILPQLRADKAAAEARFERDVAAPAREYAARLREAGGLLRTSTRPTLNLLLFPRMCISIHPEGNSCSDLGGVIVLNGPGARARRRGSGRCCRSWARCGGGGGTGGSAGGSTGGSTGGCLFSMTLLRGHRGVRGARPPGHGSPTHAVYTFS